jgi:DNA-binding transcriptional ArsR family regulator
MSDLFGLLRDQRRRLIIYYLRNHTDTEPINVGTLATAIASLETDGQHPWTGDTSIKTRQHPADAGGKHEQNWTERVEISLVHMHLPKLHEHGIVEFDRENRTVETTHPPDEFWDCVEDCQRFITELAGTKLSTEQWL